jgi:hypothetical protein
VVRVSAVGWRARVVLAAMAVWVLVPVGLAGVAWPRYWTYLAAEQTPMTWLQSVVLVLAAATCALVGFMLRPGAGGSHRCPGAWALLSVGFGWLALDERFAVHERIRDGFLAPRGIRLPFLPWVAPGDFLLLAVGVVGLAVLPMVWRAVRVEPWSRRLLAVGVALAVAAVAADSIDPSTWSQTAERFEQSAEEAVELGSGLAFLSAVLIRLLGVLDRQAEPATMVG